MKRKKIYRGGTISIQGWRVLLALAEKIFGTPTKIDGLVNRDSGHWGYNTIAAFLVDVLVARSDAWVYFTNDTQVHVWDDEAFNWELINATQEQIIEFEREVDTLIKEHWIRSGDKHRLRTEGWMHRTTTPVQLISEQVYPPLDDRPLKIFIGHGRAPDWRDLKDHLTDKHRIGVEAFETGARAGLTIQEILLQMLDRSSLAIMVHTPEDELMDGTFNSRPNVIHETGLFQGRLGFSRAIVLLKDGTSEFSNLAGVQQLRYTDIRQTFGDVLSWIKRETG